MIMSIDVIVCSDYEKLLVLISAGCQFVEWPFDIKIP